jgi:hypothetical protein
MMTVERGAGQKRERSRAERREEIKGVTLG